MTGVIPELAVVTTSVGAVMIRLGLGKGFLQRPQRNPQMSLLWPSDRRLRLSTLHREQALIFGIPARALTTIAALVRRAPIVSVP